MDFQNIIGKFMTEKVGYTVIVCSDTSEIVYTDPLYLEKCGEDITGKKVGEACGWHQECLELITDGDAVEWEYIDASDKKYYSIKSARFSEEKREYEIHLLTDITGYMSLNRDVTKYMGFFKKLSKFQTAVLEKLSDTYYELLPLVADYLKTDRTCFLLQRGDNVEIITFDRKEKNYSNERISRKEAEKQGLFAEDKEKGQAGDTMPASGDYTLISGEISGDRYAVTVHNGPGTDRDALREPAFKSVIRLYIENGVMREKLVYESEHDGLTGLLNKGKYLSMAEKNFVGLDSIAIFNFDVNNLKKMNDLFGHEAGDKLIIKSADSIRKVINNKVHGFRMGGDEFLMVAENVTRKETDTIKKRWEEELARLNTADDGINCVIALGVAYGEKGYDYAALLKLADERMYEDKKSKKKPGEEIR